MQKSNTLCKAEKEFEILEKISTEDNPVIVMEFRAEILALVDKFGKSGQSGGSAPYVAQMISNVVKNLCMQLPIAPIIGEDDEWSDISSISDKPAYQNIRCSTVFKNSKEGTPYYLDAIVFKGQSGSCFTSNGDVTTQDGKIIRSHQYIKLPFTPKTFYIDVMETEWADKTETVQKEGGGWWTSRIKDEDQLKEVFEYYDEYI